MKSSNNFRKVLAFIVLTAAIGVALPVVSLAGQGDAPMIPINVEVRSTFPISSDLENRLIAVTTDLIRKNLSELSTKSFRMDASANVLEKSSRDYAVEVLIVSLFKESYTAHMSRIEFTYKDGRVILGRVEPNFQPK
jgi:hypothetical protein